MGAWIAQSVYRWTTGWTVGVRFLAGEEIFLYSKASRPAVGFTHFTSNLCWRLACESELCSGNDDVIVSFRISSERCNGRYQTAKERTQTFKFSDVRRCKPSTSFSLFLNHLKYTDVISARPNLYFVYA
jgi:hypothetical protein